MVVTHKITTKVGFLYTIIQTHVVFWDLCINLYIILFGMNKADHLMSGVTVSWVDIDRYEKQVGYQIIVSNVFTPCKSGLLKIVLKL